MRLILYSLTNTFQLVFILVFTTFIYPSASAQSQQEPDEIPVTLHDKYLGITEIHSIFQNEKLFLSITDVFYFLKISFHHSPKNDSLIGFIHHAQDKYLIDPVHNQIIYNNHIHNLKNGDILLFSGSFFLKYDLFGEIFGLNCLFNIRELSVYLTSQTQLPVVKMMLLEQKLKHFNMSKLSFSADTTIGRNAKLLHLGAADWTINATEYANTSSHVRLGLSVGATLAGGELRTVFSHTFNRPFSQKQQHYLWRLTNHKSQLVSQILVGKIPLQAISTIVDPVIGLQITNSPSFLRKEFGTYSTSDMTIPNSLVEIYVNNTLINYARSDPSGFLTYEIPLVYGSTHVELRYYGPNGEEQIIVKKFIMPLTFLPSNEFQYRMSSGFIEDGQSSFFSQGRINYGLTDQITIGGGIEYTMSGEVIQNLPFINASIKLSPNTFATGEYVSHVRYKTSFIYQTPSRLQLEVNYTKYDQGQEAVQYNYAENRSVSISMPFRTSKSSFFTRLSFNQNFLGTQAHNNLEAQFSLNVKGFNMNVTNYANFSKGRSSKVYNSVSTSVQFPAHIRFITRVHYDYTDRKEGSFNVGIEKFISQDFSTFLSYEDKFGSKGQYLRIGFQSNLSFGRINSNITYTNENSIYHQSAAGSIVYDKKNQYLDFTRHSMIGRGGIAFISFIDLNGNGSRDKNEILNHGLNVTCIQGGGKKIQTDSSIIIIGLEPHIFYEFKADGNFFENIAWKISNPSLSVSVEPNQIKLVEIPVVPMGEVSGTVKFMNHNSARELHRVNINIYNKDSTVIASFLTEEDGFFSYLGLKPGQYTARIDTASFKNMTYKNHPEFISFSIEENIDGDIVDDLLFELTNE